MLKQSKLQVLLVLTLNFQVLRAAITAVTPPMAQVILGRSTSLYCYGQAGDQLYWFDEHGVAIRQGSHRGIGLEWYSQSFTIKSLRFASAQAEHEGAYCCSLLQSSCSDGRIATLNVIFPSAEFIVPRIQYVQPDLNGDVFIKCGITPGDPKPRIVWFLVGKGFLNLTDTSKYAANYSGLLVHQFNSEDIGEYTCEYLSHLSGSYVSDTQVRLVGTVLITGLKQLQVGSDLSLQCFHDGRLSNATVHWVLPDGSTRQGTRLDLVNVGADQDGIYQCQVHGRLSNGSNETMKADHKVSIFDPPLPVEFKDQVTIFSETTAQLRLVLKNEPFPPLTEFTWMKNKEVLEPAASKYTIDDETGVLTILSVRKGDTGSYTCVGGNGFGNSTQTFDVSWIQGASASGELTEVAVIVFGFTFKAAVFGSSQSLCQELKLNNASLEADAREHLVNNVCHCVVVVVVNNITCYNGVEGEVTMRLSGPGASNVASYLGRGQTALLNSSLILTPRIANSEFESIDITIVIIVGAVVGAIVLALSIVVSVAVIAAIACRLTRKRAKSNGKGYTVEQVATSNSPMGADVRNVMEKSDTSPKQSVTVIAVLSESPKYTWGNNRNSAVKDSSLKHKDAVYAVPGRSLSQSYPKTDIPITPNPAYDSAGMYC